MADILNLLLTPTALAFLVALTSTPAVIWFYKKNGWVDDPKKKSHSKVTHTRPVPRGGGIPVFISLFIVGILTFGFEKHFLGILTGGLILTIVGIFDDIYDVSPYLRLATGILAALAVVGVGIGIAYVTNPVGVPGSVINLNQPQIPLEFLGKTRTIWVVSDILALIWIVWLMNIVNWSKGVDGQMPGFVAIAAIFIGLLSFRFIDDITQWEVIRLASITAGAYLGLLVFNIYPQKIMPGYGAGSLAGFLLAVLAILSGAKVATMILILGIPIMDAFYTIIRRITKGQSPVWGDRGHLHHRLLDIGWSKTKIAIFYWSITFIFGLLGLKLNSSQKLFTIIMLAMGVGGLIIWLKLLSENLKNPNPVKSTNNHGKISNR